MKSPATEDQPFSVGCDPELLDILVQGDGGLLQQARAGSTVGVDEPPDGADVRGAGTADRDHQGGAGGGRPPLLSLGSGSSPPFLLGTRERSGRMLRKLLHDRSAYVLFSLQLRLILNTRPEVIT